MSIYRCSACGSPNVVTASENGGFSYSKGIAGAIVFGAPGAVAGINGKTKQVFKCPDCGLTLDSPMSNEIKVIIDLGLMSEEARNNLTLEGIKIDWNTLTNKYKNIEKSYVDKQIAERTEKKKSSIANDKKVLEQKATATKKEFDDAIDTFFDLKAKDGYFREEDRVFCKEHPITKEEYVSGLESIITIVENIYKYIPPKSYKPGVQYRGKSIYLDNLFLEYVIIYHYSLTGMPFFHTKSTIEKLIESNPFIAAFVRQYSDANDFFNVKLYGWLISEYSGNKVYTCGSFLTSYLCFWVRCDIEKCGKELGKFKKFLGIDFQEIWLPKFTVIDDKLCYWYKSFRDSEPIDRINFIELKKNYLKNHKDKVSEFNDFLKETEAQFKRYDSLVSEKDAIPDQREKYEEEIEKITEKNKSINTQISNNSYEIDRLSRKIFFKSKAHAQIAELQKENDSLRNQLEENNKNIKNYKEKIDDCKDMYTAATRVCDKMKQDFYNVYLQQLFAKMNNFIDWITGA